MATCTTPRLRPLRLEAEVRTLPNGLRLALHRDRTSAAFALQWMVHAGSRHDPPRRSGTAHLLEHLLFEGSAHLPPGAYDRILEAAGGSSNASTWFDRTHYHAVVPAAALRQLVWLERERLLEFAPALTDDAVAVQRQVVINERRQAYENRPYGLAEETLFATLFPPGHPYARPTIGWTEDIARIDTATLRTFHATYYRPERIVLVAAGQVDDAVATLLEESFAPMSAAGPPPPPEAVGPPAVGGGPTVRLPDAVSFPRWYLGWCAPPYGTTAYAALDLALYALADGESSPLVRELVRRRRLAHDVEGALYPLELNAVLLLTLTVRRAGQEEETRRAAFDTIAAAIDRLDDARLEAARRRARRDHVAALADVEDRAAEIAHALTFLGSLDALHRFWDAYLELDVDAVRRLASAVLDPTRGAAVLVESKAP